jgi:hypothetical protein
MIGFVVKCYADVCRQMLPYVDLYVDVCWRMLTYAKVWTEGWTGVGRAWQSCIWKCWLRTNINLDRPSTSWLMLTKTPRRYTTHYLSIRQHSAAFVSIRQHTTVYRVPRPCASEFPSSVSLLVLLCCKARKLKFTVLCVNPTYMRTIIGLSKPSCNGFYRLTSFQTKDDLFYEGYFYCHPISFILLGLFLLSPKNCVFQCNRLSSIIKFIKLSPSSLSPCVSWFCWPARLWGRWWRGTWVLVGPSEPVPRLLCRRVTHWIS